MKSTKIKILSTALDDVLKQYGLDIKLRKFEALNVWEKVVGEQIAKVTKPERIERDVLYVRVKKAVWRNELVFLKKEIIKKINKELEEEIVKEIVFR